MSVCFNLFTLVIYILKSFFFSINQIFNLDSDRKNLDAFNNIKIINGPIIQHEIEKIMEKWHGKKEGKEYKIILN